MLFSIEFERAKGFKAMANQTQAALLKGMQDGLNAAADKIVADAKEKVPKWKNNLQNSIQKKQGAITKDSIEIFVGTTLPYAMPTEAKNKPHWTRLTDLLWKWFADHNVPIKGERGAWVDPTKSGKRHFVPFSMAPKLKDWMEQHGKLPVKAVFFKGRIQPFLVPAIENNGPSIRALMQYAINVSIEGIWK